GRHEEHRRRARDDDEDLAGAPLERDEPREVPGGDERPPDREPRAPCEHDRAELERPVPDDEDHDVLAGALRGDVAEDGADGETVVYEVEGRAEPAEDPEREAAERDPDVVVDVESGHERAIAGRATAAEALG